MVFLLILVLAALLQHFLPWWVITPIAFGAAWAGSKSPGKAFLSGFLAVFLLWLGMSVWLYAGNDGILAGRVGRLFGGLPGWLLPVISALIGGLTAGVAAWSGFLVRNAFGKPADQRAEIPEFPSKLMR